MEAAQEAAAGEQTEKKEKPFDWVKEKIKAETKPNGKNDKPTKDEVKKKTAKGKLHEDVGRMDREGDDTEPIDKRKFPGKDGRGRPKGSIKPPKEKQDLIMSNVNQLLLPILAKIWGLPMDKVLLTKEELALLASLQPETDFTKPSWPAYIITSLVLLAGHITGGFVFKNINKMQEQELQAREAKKKEEEPIGETRNPLKAEFHV
jgi:hypothetical protein